MVFDFIKADFTITRRKLASVVLLVSTSFASLFLLFNWFPDIFKVYISNESVVYTGYFLFLGAAAISAIIGSIVSERVNRRKLLVTWIFFGLLANISIILADIPTVLTQEIGAVTFYLISAVLGISVGFGFPSCLACLADCTTVEERGRVTGITLFVTLVLGMLLMLGPNLFNLGIEIFILYCVVKGLGLFAFASGDCKRKKSEKSRSWTSVFTSKDFTLYLFPWLMFSLAGSLNTLIFDFTHPLPEYQSIDVIAMILHYLAWAICSIIPGIMADRIGRKQPLMLGLILLGVSYAIFGIYTHPATFILYQVISGVAWGFIFTVYTTLLGDLASYGSKEKFYAMGVIMPITLMSLSPLIGLLNVTASITILSPIYSCILFLSMYPVWRASETLPGKRIRERAMKNHIEKIGKLIEESEKQD